MNRELQLTEDGSHTLFVEGLDETYHSIHGAIQESMHVYINQGFKQVQKSTLNILEIGFGTGLNLLLTLRESEKFGINIFYHAVEKYPLVTSEYSKLNYESLIPGIPAGSLLSMHEAFWGIKYNLTGKFELFKERSDFRGMNPKGSFDLVYFDAFAPDKQPELWSKEVFSKVYKIMNPAGILVSYSSKADVRRALVSCGFEVKKVPGPPGKVEMICATRI